MDRWVGKVAIVTGASSGIGLAIAESLVHAGVKVVAIARRKERLEDLAKRLSDRKGELHPYPADLTIEQAILEAFDWTRKNLGPVQVLVNNAGALMPTTLTNGDSQLWRKCFDLNILAMCITSRETIKDIMENGLYGHIIQMNSVAGHGNVALPRMNVYPATKYGVTALCDTWNTELIDIPNNIKMTSISPGYVATEIFEVAGHTKDPAAKEALDKMPAMLSEDIADAVIFVLSTPPNVMVSELIIKPVGEAF